VLNESRKRDGMEKLETKQTAIFVNPNESRKSTKKKHMAVIALDLF
jgi:hypothetical protein